MWLCESLRIFRHTGSVSLQHDCTCCCQLPSLFRRRIRLRPPKCPFGLFDPTIFPNVSFSRALNARNVSKTTSPGGCQVTVVFPGDAFPFFPGHSRLLPCTTSPDPDLSQSVSDCQQHTVVVAERGGAHGRIKLLCVSSVKKKKRGPRPSASRVPPTSRARCECARRREHGRQAVR